MNVEIKKRVKTFSELSNFIENHLNGTKIPGLENFHEELDKIIETNFHYNGWFTPQSVKIALGGIVSMLNEKDLNAFAETIVEEKERRVAVIMAGNIPAVGFHDLLCVLLSGHKIIIKPSSDDHLLIPFFTKLLIHFEPEFSDKIYFAEAKLTNFDAVIATGNNNSSRYFEYYFGKYPHIIRKNRNSIAILNGNETKAELALLGTDIFTFFGLGCRNVSKIYAPDGYDFGLFFDAMYEFRSAIDNKKYGNNYEYHRALFLLEGIKFLDNNFMILRQEQKTSSQVSVIHYQFYSDKSILVSEIGALDEKIQCMVGNKFEGLDLIPFGMAQSPKLSDFADGINTLEFLRKLG